MGLGNNELAFVLVLAAGMSTCIGAAAVYFPSFIQLASKKTLAGSLGLSAGVMLYVSFIEIFRKSIDSFETGGANSSDAYLYATLCFFAGFFLMNMLNMLVHKLDPDDIGHEDIDFDILENIVDEDLHRQPADEVQNVAINEDREGGRLDIELRQRNVVAELNTATSAKDKLPCDVDLEKNDAKSVDEQNLSEKRKKIDDKLHRMGLVTALAIGIHNFPEGLATFVATLDDPTVGAALAVAIAIHNIPEGLCVSIPIYFASGDRNKAFFWGCVSGASEVVAAALGWIVLSHSVGDFAYAVLFGAVAGMMVNICVYQLIPTAHKYDHDDSTVSHFIVIGMGIMALSLVVFLY